MTDAQELNDDDRRYSRPAARLSGDWSAHLATTLDRLVDLLRDLDEVQWKSDSLCAEWAVRDVVGHLVWRLGASNAELLRTGIGAGLGSLLDPHTAIANIARHEAARPTDELVARLSEISRGKLAGEGRTGIIELTEAVVHATDIALPLQLPLRLSPRSTAVVAMHRLRARGANTRIARRRSLRAVDAGWQIGQGEPLDATAGEIIAHLYGRVELVE